MLLFKRKLTWLTLPALLNKYGTTKMIDQPYLYTIQSLLPVLDEKIKKILKNR